MRLTAYADYALRVMMYLGVKQDGLATIAEIAAAYGISESHLTKVVQALGRLGYVETLRGRGGGLRLAQDPHAVSLGEVVRRMEPDFALVPCFAADGPHCRIECSCALKGVFRDALDAFMAALDQRTLADLLGPRARLSVLLSGTASRPDQPLPI